MSDKNQKDIGGLWLNESQNGKKYMAGKITIDGREHSIIVFRNDRKQPGERTPDYRIYPKQQRQQSAAPRNDFEDSAPF